MRVLIVDDEPPARARLRRMLEQAPGIVTIAEAGDGVEALHLVAHHRPDVAFLDIHMPELTGIELAASLPDPAPLVVFATAYDSHAVAAFDAGAVDYLLKPYDEARVMRALERARARLAVPAVKSVPQLPVRQLLITERGVTRVVRVDDIQWIETADNYVVLHTASGQPLMRQTLTGLLERLGSAFVRCHRRGAVQVSWVESIIRLGRGDSELVLRGGVRVPCSRQYRDEVMARL